MKRRVAARLLLASCTLALGLGLGTAVAVAGILALRHPSITVRSPGAAVGSLDRGPHHLLVLRGPGDAGGDAPGAGSPPACTLTDVRTGAAAPAASAAVRVGESGAHRVACSSAIPVTVEIHHDGEGALAWLAAIGRGLLPAVVLTLLAAVLAARALVTAGRLRQSPPAPEAEQSPPAPEAEQSPP